MQHRVILINCALLFTSSCTFYKEKPLSPEETLKAFQERSLEDPKLKAFIEEKLSRSVPSWPLERWDLEFLTQAAFFYNPNLEVANANWEVAKATIVTAGMIPNPTFTFLPIYSADSGGGGSSNSNNAAVASNTAAAATGAKAKAPSPARTTSAGGGGGGGGGGINHWTFNPDLEIPIETAGKRGIRIAQAEHSAKAAFFSLSQVAWETRSAVRAAFLSLYSARVQKELIRQQQNIQEKVVEALAKQNKAGQVDATELTKGQIELTELVTTLHDAEKQERLALSQLASYIGVTIHALKNASFDFSAFAFLPTKEAATLNIMKSAATLNRSDLLNLLSEYAASEEELRLQIRKQFPDLNLNPGYLWDQGTNEWYLGIGFELPVFNQNQGPIAEALAKRNAVYAQFQALQAQISQEVEQALTIYVSEREKMSLAYSIYLLKQKQFLAEERQFQAKGKDLSSYLSAQIEFLAAQSSYKETIANAFQSLGKLEDAIQCVIPIVNEKLVFSSPKAPSLNNTK